MAAADATIDIRGVGKRYVLGAGRATTLREAASERLRGRRTPTRELWSLRGVDLEVRAGETIGIVGRNGAGKSTLLRLIASITQPTEGVVRTRGRIASILEVGAGFHPELTGRENVYVNGAILGMTRREVDARFDDIVGFSELERFIDDPVKHYSSGMYMRLAFAVAAHVEADILLVDEALAVGDAGFRNRCLAHMEDAATGGRTVVLVSHDITAFERLCDRGIWLEGGRVVLDDVADVVAARYLDEVDDEYLSNRELPGDASGGARIASARVVAPDGSKLDEVVHGAPFAIQLEVEVREPVEGLDVSIRMRTQRRLQVVHEALRPVDPDLADRLATPGMHRIRMHVPPLLGPELYTIGAWLGTPERELADYPWALQFRVRGGDSGWRDRLVDLSPRWTLDDA